MKLFLVLCLLCLPSMVRAQDVFNYVLDNATRVVNSPTSGYTQAQIAQFKRTSLLYLQKKAFEQSETVATDLLDTQAYYLSEFLTLFFTEVMKDKKQPEAVRKNKILLFMNASVMNPMWNDTDRETTHAFIDDKESMTPFCLDTDWQKAYAAAVVNLESLR